MQCCSLAVFTCGGGSTYCTPCHNDVMAHKRTILSKCTGGPKCPLGIPNHPRASTNKTSSFPMGCSLCRSEKLALISTNDDAKTGINLEVRKGYGEEGKEARMRIFENEEEKEARVIK